MASRKLKKDLRLKVEETLSRSFINIEGEISQKKMKRNIKKASKVLLTGLKVTPTKKKVKKLEKLENGEMVKKVDTVAN